MYFFHNGQKSLANLIERSGAQGMYSHNQIAAFESLTRATGIAEGEVLVLFIHMFTSTLDKIGNHRSDEYNHHILPRCRPLVLAIGQRMAYEAADAIGIDPNLPALYEAASVESDSSWYVKNPGLSRADPFEMECKALNAVLPRLDKYLNSYDIVQYCTAPILSTDRWGVIMNAVPTFAGDAHVDIPLGVD
ncbi:acyl-CoA oxidase [Penicillium longicatenatum]|uniref:acyl-CoA oxidase n=1 Tax=Penicillium longicatenatum TaxID=1561947 RepID=UPI0025477B21|nr:acyl-CoA oxidase [Penicillium longicatenatum]KAJ5648804.1 acyl-CoA oxidase [Penicillium longicatenatum]